MPKCEIGSGGENEVGNGRCPVVKLEVVRKVVRNWRSPGVKLQVEVKVGG